MSEKSGGLSEGQAQRIAIARALIGEKPVLILDDDGFMKISTLSQYYESK